MASQQAIASSIAASQTPAMTMAELPIKTPWLSLHMTSAEPPLCDLTKEERGGLDRTVNGLRPTNKLTAPNMGLVGKNEPNITNKTCK